MTNTLEIYNKVSGTTIIMAKEEAEQLAKKYPEYYELTESEVKETETKAETVAEEPKAEAEAKAEETEAKETAKTKK